MLLSSKNGLDPIGMMGLLERSVDISHTLSPFESLIPSIVCFVDNIYTL